MVREGLKMLLERAGLKVVREASDGQEAVRRVRDLVPDVAVLDLAMPLLNGLEAAREILRDSPRTRPILLTMHTEDPYVTAALRVGVKAYVLKTQSGPDLVQAIQEVCRGRIYLSPGISRTVVEAYLAKTELPPDPLSPREREVLQLVAGGKTTKEIARLLGMGVKTAENFWTRLRTKTSLAETAGLVRTAIQTGGLRPSPALTRIAGRCA